MQTSWVSAHRPPPALAHPPRGSAPVESRLDTPTVAAFLLPYVVRAHARGELPLQAAIERCRDLLEAMPFGLRHERQDALRQQVCELLRNAPEAAVVPQQACWTEACHDLVGLVSREEGLAIARIVKHGATAFERAAQLMNGCGVPATASSVEKARSGWRRACVAEPA